MGKCELDFATHESSGSWIFTARAIGSAVVSQGLNGPQVSVHWASAWKHCWIAETKGWPGHCLQGGAKTGAASPGLCGVALVV
jgi:hypothetical protein